jgi:hypothetical protein
MNQNLVEHVYQNKPFQVSLDDNFNYSVYNFYHHSCLKLFMHIKTYGRNDLILIPNQDGLNMSFVH